MKGWYSIVLVLFIFYTAMLLLALIDKNGKKTVEEEPKIETSVDNPVDHNDLERDRIQILEAGEDRVCGMYDNRRVGIRMFAGTVCIENGMKIAVHSGRMSEADMQEYYYPLIDSLRREYELKFGGY